jgi:hypothetical protein
LFTIGNARRALADVNSPAYQDFDFQQAKDTDIAEGSRVQIRMEMFNSLNHPVLAGPNTGLTSGQFGVISGYQGGAASARRIQLAAKFTF